MTETPAERPDPGVAGDAEWAAQARPLLVHADMRLCKRFDQGEPIERLVVLRARAVDQLMRNAWTRCIPADSGLSLHAVGGYGRGELFPRSDVDVLVLGESVAQQQHEQALARLFALLWDVGLPISHAVRSPAQCTAAAADQTVLTALIESRALVADAAARAALAAAIAPPQVWPPRDFFQAKREELLARHQRFGDTADNLEPDIKDGPGGLRDLQTLGWMALRAFGVKDLEALVGLGHVGFDEAAALRREREELARLRFGLHIVANRPEERLRFDYQKTLAERLGFADDLESLGVEKMMQRFYRSAALIRRISDRLLQRFEEQFDGEATLEPLRDGFSLRRGYLAADSDSWPGNDVLQVFALFAQWAAHREVRGLHSLTARALAEVLRELPAYDMADATARERFMALLRGPRAVETLNRMARLGVLGQWIPAFASVSGRMQFDLFHVYTVDQHTLMVLRNIALFAAGRADERFSIAHEVWPRLRKPELLLLAGLFHDIAKGRGGDHSELGAVDARAFCLAHRLSEGDTELVTWLVEQHLRMSVTAQKQDISDAEVIHRFATLVGTRERLDYLYLLTCADIAGTSPKLWNAWKDRLLADLYFAARRALREGLEHPPPREERLREARESARALMQAQGHDDATIDRQFGGMPDENFLRFRPEQLAWQAASLIEVDIGQTLVKARRAVPDNDALEVFVYSPDRDGLFAAIVATLDRKGYGIHRARVLDAPHDAIFDVFEVLPQETYADGDPQRLAATLRQVLAGDLQKVRPARRAVPRQLRHFRFAPRVEFSESAGGRRTRISLVAPDRPGLLADVAHVLRIQHLRVHDARIATFGERAEDQFQITDEHDRPLSESARQALRDALCACLDPV
ncbi:TPA: [protein-PII] uridylyltransferase [Xanthomonas vasicola pv. zeae]|uniref:Bifunctional uridylyltransferase/uridylyl-removing enzyme n=3 Tax=Xanthomonas vasicola TaxID=56459 RepID=A0AAE8JWG3_XANVA|nr:[protein-PII] uridylyltransferase [Xanthomonas vasicola]AVQ06524.1 bifunctional uridylyltransferase/uridylyl-removing protein [Xanthomonas vasicola pv. vasculorum]AZM70724.1 bifunctional uridylyltransferase/uridylyl-removing protein [Xanthomonas vasicola pv. vasculorum]KFA06144.1 protein-PII uridylyltransferase [Xanthomonas vasicola pv. musacearum NCPPB 2005]KFA37462.1 protein-PII uridylyltransferase [Xanthomonas vasicola pv. vasculorum NCPPB 206]MBV6741296.1 [protein-PII] uridylyltransfera